MTVLERCQGIKDHIIALEALSLPPRVRVALRKLHNDAAGTVLDHGEALGLTSDEITALAGTDKPE